MSPGGIHQYCTSSLPAQEDSSSSQAYLQPKITDDPSEMNRENGIDIAAYFEDRRKAESSQSQYVDHSNQRVPESPSIKPESYRSSDYSDMVPEAPLDFSTKTAAHHESSLSVVKRQNESSSSLTNPLTLQTAAASIHSDSRRRSSGGPITEAVVRSSSSPSGLLTTAAAFTDEDRQVSLATMAAMLAQGPPGHTQGSPLSSYMNNLTPNQRLTMLLTALNQRGGPSDVSMSPSSSSSSLAEALPTNIIELAKLNSESQKNYNEFQEEMLPQFSAATRTKTRRRSSSMENSSSSHNQTANQTTPTSTSSANEKDDAYWQRRKKNNEAAKRSRDARRSKENEIAMRAKYLETENYRLKLELAGARAEMSHLKDAVRRGNSLLTAGNI